MTSPRLFTSRLTLSTRSQTGIRSPGPAGGKCHVCERKKKKNSKHGKKTTKNNKGGDTLGKECSGATGVLMYSFRPAAVIKQLSAALFPRRVSPVKCVSSMTNATVATQANERRSRQIKIYRTHFVVVVSRYLDGGRHYSWLRA